MHSSVQLEKWDVCVLYMNIRSAKDKQGYPYRDNIPARILTGHCVTGAEYRIQCSAFFAAIFKVLRKALENEKDPLSWRAAMCKMGSSARDSFFADLETEYTNASTMNNISLPYSHICRSEK